MIVVMVHLAAGPATAEIDLEHGGRIASLRVHDLELLEQRTSGPSGNEPFGWGSFVMAPWAGRLRDGRIAWRDEQHTMVRNMGPHAIHGLGTSAVWDLLAQGDDWAVLGLRLGRPWPWGGTVVQHVVLRDDRLVQAISVHAADRDLPATVGWHPWFRRDLGVGGPLELSIDLGAAVHLVKDGTGIPIGETGPIPPHPWDDCFTGVGSIELVWPGALRLEIEHDCSHVVVYEPEHAVCIEPQSGPPDAFALEPDVHVVAAGDVLERMTAWSWRLDTDDAQDGSPGPVDEGVSDRS